MNTHNTFKFCRPFVIFSIICMMSLLCFYSNGDTYEAPYRYDKEEYVTYFYDKIMGAVQQRCLVCSGGNSRFGPGIYDSGDSKLYSGDDGWDTAVYSKGKNNNIFYRDIMGNGTCDSNDYIWYDSDSDGLYDHGTDLVIKGSPESENDQEWGKQNGIFYNDKNGNNKWDVDEDVWGDNNSLFDDMQHAHNMITSLIPGFVNHLDNNGNWNGQTEFAPFWTENELLQHCTVKERIPCEISDQWIKQQKEILDLLLWTVDENVEGRVKAVTYDDKISKTCQLYLWHECYELTVSSKSGSRKPMLICEDMTAGTYTLIYLRGAVSPVGGWNQLRQQGYQGYGIYFCLDPSVQELYDEPGTATVPAQYGPVLPGFIEGGFETYSEAQEYAVGMTTQRSIQDGPLYVYFNDNPTYDNSGSVTYSFYRPEDVPKWDKWTLFGEKSGTGSEFLFDVWASESRLSVVRGKAVFKYDFKQLETPPSLTQEITTEESWKNQVEDSNRDGLVDVGVDLMSFGADSGQIAFLPEHNQARSYIPLTIGQWDSLPVHSYIVSGGFDDCLNHYWTHPDCDDDGISVAYSLHTRARIQAVIINDTEHTKRIEVIRPTGNAVTFEFEWDGNANNFQSCGFPIDTTTASGDPVKNSHRTYVLRDITPDNHLDLKYELRFDSGIIHHFKDSNGLIEKVSHIDGRSIQVDSLSGCEIDLIKSTSVSPKYNVSWEWENGRISKVTYSTRDKKRAITSTIDYDADGNISNITKSIPAFSVSYNSGTNAITHGTGVKITRTGDKIETAIPDCGTASTIYTFNSNGLLSNRKIILGDYSTETGYEYDSDTGRYSDNGVPKWSKLKRINHPHGRYEEFEYYSDSGWLKKHKSLFKNSLNHIKEYSYKNTDSAGNAADQTALIEQPRKIVTTVDGVITAIDFFSYSDSNLKEIEHQQANDKNAVWDSSTNLKTVTTRNTLGPPTRETPVGIYSYNSSLNQDKTELITEFSTPSQQNGIYKVNAFGQKFYSKLTDEGVTIGESSSETDSFGRLTRTDYLDGTSEEYNDYTIFGPKSVARKFGKKLLNETTYDYYPVGHVKSTDDLFGNTTFKYDAQGNAIEIVRKPKKEEALKETFEYDAQNRLRKQTIHYKKPETTSWAYNNDNLTITYPNTKTKIINLNLDGSTASIQGTAVHHLTYDYGVDGSKGQWTKTIGSSDPNGEKWTITYRNMRGQAYRTENSAGYWQETEFDDKGRPWKVTDSNSAESITEYNDKNEVVKSTVNGDETIYSRSFGVKDGKTTLKNTTTVKNDIKDIVTVQESTLDGLKSWNTVNGREMTSETVIDGNGKYSSTTTDFEKRKVVRKTDTASVETNFHELVSEKVTNDGYGRTSGIDSRTGHTAVGYNDKKSLPETVRKPDNETTVYKYADGESSPETVKTPYGAQLTFKRKDTGELKKIEGEAFGNFSAETSYDTQGKINKLKTTGVAGTAETEWVYDEKTGALKEKLIEKKKVFGIERHPDGRIDSINKVIDDGKSFEKKYSYSTAPKFFFTGYTTTVTDGVNAAPNVVISGHTTFGQPRKIETVGVSTSDYQYNDDFQIRNIIQSSPVIARNDIEYDYENLRRKSMITAYKTGADAVMFTDGETVKYTYDKGRYKTVVAGGLTFVYDYVSNSVGMIDKLTYKLGGVDGATIFTRDPEWMENSDKIESVTNILKNGTTVNSFNYKYYKNTDKIERVTFKDGSYWMYKYDPRGQMNDSNLFYSDGKPYPGMEFACLSDSITNILHHGKVRLDGTNVKTTPNLFNSVEFRFNGKNLEIYGSAVADAIVSINDNRAARTGEEFFCRLDVNNGESALYVPLIISAARFDDAVVPETGGDQPGNAPGADVVSEVSGVAFIRKEIENPVYDTAGRKVEDSRHLYKWNTEDRLIAVESRVGPDNILTKVENKFDYAGRRIIKEVFSGTPDNWDLQKKHFYYYDTVLLNGQPADFGLNTREIIVDKDNNIIASYQYVWGLDLNGVYQGLGGVGGLLAVIDRLNDKVYIPAMDSKGTVYAYIDADSQAVVATYTYDPYGRIVSQSGPMADAFTFRYQTRSYDTETYLYYYGFRFYDPSTGRWLNRDPLQESGGLNLYAFCNNDPVNKIDYLGLWGEAAHYYTTYIVARAGGFSVKQAMKLAFYSQLPDEVGDYDAINPLDGLNNGTKYLSAVGQTLGVYENNQWAKDVQYYLHCLSGTSAVKRRNTIKSILLKKTLSTEQFGVLLHVFGDSYGHSFFKHKSELAWKVVDIGECLAGQYAGLPVRIPYMRYYYEETFYPTGIGHGGTVITKGRGGSATDAIGYNYESYKLYVKELFKVLSSKNPVNTHKPEWIDMLLESTKSYNKEFDNTGFFDSFSSYNFEGEIEKIRELAINNFKLPESSFRPEIYEAEFITDSKCFGYNTLNKKKMREIINIIKAGLAK